MTGRPTIRNEDQINDILDRLTTGEPLAAILRDEGMPKPSTWYDWCGADEALSGRVARAREHGAASIAADCLRIADTQEEAVEEKFEPVEVADPAAPGGKRVELVLVERKRSDALGHRKLQIETRLKLLRCWDPKNYGDKLEVDSKGTMAVAVTIQRLSGAPVEPGEGA